MGLDGTLLYLFHLPILPGHSSRVPKVMKRHDLGHNWKLGLFFPILGHVEIILGDVLWMEEILHQLVDVGRSFYPILIPGRWFIPFLLSRIIPSVS